jgi:hypothetical protein
MDDLPYRMSRALQRRKYEQRHPRSRRHQTLIYSLAVGHRLSEQIIQ